MAGAAAGQRIRMAFDESHKASVGRLQRVPPTKADDESVRCEGIRPQDRPHAVQPVAAHRDLQRQDVTPR
jgi:hypothetical protein